VARGGSASWLRRLLWFGGLWLAGVAAVGLTAYLIRAILD